MVRHASCLDQVLDGCLVLPSRTALGSRAGTGPSPRSLPTPSRRSPSASPSSTATGHRLTLKELIAFLATKEIAKFKLPERVEVVTDFPLSTFGKVSKKTLVETVAKKLEQEHAAHHAHH
jgi:acyl-CoA synthetase (AMP-forming)/AMP-acid ligase II